MGAYPKLSDFTVHISGNNQSPDTFPGSEAATNVTLGFGSYQVTEEYCCRNSFIDQHLGISFSKDCVGVIHPDETKTCTVTNTFNPILDIIYCIRMGNLAITRDITN
jgi:hypothetical protein